MKNTIRKAFVRSRSGFSPDRVVADPELNSHFLTACRELKLEQPAAELNKFLLNARKAGFLTGLPRSKRTSFQDEDEYRFASEVAARHLQQKCELSLDDIICDPERAKEFDSLAETISPGYTPLQYRWAALNLRKSKQLQPELLSEVLPPEAIDLGPASRLDLRRLPASQGIYVFFGDKATLYVGESENLRKRVTKHLDHSDNKGLAHWFWENGFKNVCLEYRVLPSRTSKRVRTALESELIKSRRPLFNVRHT